jgi:dipeptidase
MNLSPDYHRAVEDAEPYPLWIKPDEKLSLSDVFSIMRDHYEGTDYDMTQGLDAGPYGNPNRWRPMDWEVDSVKYVWERPISTQQTGFSMVSQSRGWLPDPVGGVLWYGVDDTYTTCYFPMYCCITDVPKSFSVGTIKRFDFESAWWTFNFVANFATIKYVHMIEDIKAVQSAIEGEFIALQPAVEKTALSLYKSDPDLMKSYLTNYTVMQGEMMTEHWRELGKYLVTKYNDGYVQDDNNRAQWQGYSDSWLRKVVESRPDQFKLPEKKSDTYESNLID